MKRLKKVLIDLEHRGLTTVDAKKIRAGSNSEIYKVTDKTEKKYALKFYKRKSIKDPRDRFNTEVSFLNYIREYTEAINVPIVIDSDSKEGWSLLNWMEGDKPVSISNELIDDATSFVRAINYTKRDRCPIYKQEASEACTSILGFVATLENRTEEILKKQPRNDLEIKAKRWLLSEYMKCYKSSIKESIKRAESKHWIDDSVCTIISPSDVGIHNTIAHKNEYFYLDFEYAGRDDMSKFAADWILHPEHIFSESQEAAMLAMLEQKFGLSSSWIKRYYDIRPLVSLKWCLIMMNPFLEGNLDKQRLKKIEDYYTKTSKYR